jgi:hypothetical protein
VPAPAAPRCVADLHVAAVVGPALAFGMERCCRWDAVGEQVDSAAPAFLLVESAALRARAPTTVRAAAERLATSARALGVPSVYWATGPDAQEADIAEAGAQFDAVAAADPTTATQLLADGRRPVQVPWGALTPVRELPSASGREPIAAYVGGWSRAAPRTAAWVESMFASVGIDRVAIVDAPELSLPGPDTLVPFPAELQDRIVGTGLAAAADLYRRASIVIAGDANRRSPDVIAPMYFEALTSGAAVVAPPQAALTSTYVVDATTLVRRDRDDTAARLETLLTAPDADALARARRGPELVVREHGLAHRIASLATLVGIRTLPAVSVPA